MPLIWREPLDSARAGPRHQSSGLSLKSSTQYQGPTSWQSSTFTLSTHPSAQFRSIILEVKNKWTWSCICWWNSDISELLEESTGPVAHMLVCAGLLWCIVTMHGHKWEWWAFSPLLQNHKVHLGEGLRECALQIQELCLSLAQSGCHYSVIIVVMGLAARVGGRCPQESLRTTTISSAKTWNDYSWTHGKHSWRLAHMTVKTFKGYKRPCVGTVG